MNLYQIEQDLLELFNTLEEQGGEFTEEQLQQLQCTQEDFKNKLEGYYKYIKNIQSDIAQCKDEEKRIKLLRQTRENTVERLKSVMLQAVTTFGNQQKNGVMAIEYPTFKLSTRKSVTTEVNEQRVEDFIRLIRDYITEMGVMCQLDDPANISIEGMLGAINAIYKAEFEKHSGSDFDLDKVGFVPFTIEDFNLVEIEVSAHLRMKDLFGDKEYQPLIVAISNIYSMKMVFDTPKDIIKSAIEYCGNITLAHQSGNLSLQMK